MKTRSGNLKKVLRLSWGLASALIIMFSPGAEVKGAMSLSALPDLSLLTPFATFGKLYNDSAVTINGDAGISAGGTVNVMAPSTINGELYLATGATKTGPGTVTGTIFTGQDLAAAQSQVFSASSTLHSFTADQNLGTVNVPAGGVTFGSINGVADVTVINVDQLTTGGGNINFVGDPGDYYVLNIRGLSMTGSAAIQAPSGHLLVNFWDSSVTSLGTIAHVGNLINGTTLIPYASATLHSVSGAIYSGERQITLMSDATVNYDPFTPVPEPTTIFAGLGALLLFGAALQSRRSGVLRVGK